MKSLRHREVNKLFDRGARMLTQKSGSRQPCAPALSALCADSPVNTNFRRAIHNNSDRKFMKCSELSVRYCPEPFPWTHLILIEKCIG